MNSARNSVVITKYYVVDLFVIIGGTCILIDSQKNEELRRKHEDEIFRADLMRKQRELEAKKKREEEEKARKK